MADRTSWAHDVGQHARRFVREHRRSRVVSSIARACEGYLRAYHNEGCYDFDRNGEGFVLEACSRHFGDAPTVAWDVGANEGEWSQLACAAMPGLDCYAFEIVSATFDELSSRIASETRVHPLHLGLSDRAGVLRVTTSTADTRISAIDPRLDHWTFLGEVDVEEATVTTGDELIERADAPAPDILKVDVEGHELHVFRGLRACLASEQRPTLIQFEYGQTYLASGSTLREVSRLLEDAGYRVGRLFPGHVEFAAFTSDDESFRMGNYIATCDPALERTLASS